LIDYVNVPSTIGILISTKMATLHELQTVYGMEDVMDMLEILMVDNKNRQTMERAARANNH